MPEERTVLVIDDNARSRAFVIATLTREHYVITEAGDAATAVEELRNHEFTTVLLDFKMPHNGVAFIDFLSDSMPHVLARTIVFIPDVNRPIWGVLPKPVDPAALVRLVGACAAQ